MEVLLEILIRASISIAIFYAMYWLLLRQSTHFKANRYFLLFSLLVSIVIAALPLQYEVLVQAPATSVLNEFNGTFNHDIADTNAIVDSKNSMPLSSYLLFVYCGISAIILLRILIQCRKPLQIISQSTPKKINNCLVYENKAYIAPFSFFNYILINPEYFKQDEIDDILTHEKVHIHERHWIDLFIIELLTVFFWFNPFIWLFERAIKQNHEYLADEGVLTRGHSPVRYQALLINRLMGTQVIGLANHFSSSLGPTRFKMMTKEKTAKRKLFRMIWGIPVLAILLMAFAKPEYKMQSQKEVKTNTVTTTKGQDATAILPDGSKVFLQEDSKITYSEKFAKDNKEITLEGEAFFNLKESNNPLKVITTGRKTINTSLNNEKEFIVPKTNPESIQSEEIKSEKPVQQKIIKLKGKVIDENGNPLTGSSIILRKTTTGTVVDRDGTFELSIPKSKKMDLVISFVGYKTIVKKIDPSKERQNFDISMKRGVISIDSKTMFLDGDVPPPPPPPAPEFIEGSDKPVFIVVEDIPHYPNGMYGLGQLVKKQKGKLKEELFFKGEKLEGKATVGFTVTKNGKVTNVQILNKTNKVAAKAAKAIVAKMEDWKPGSQRGKKVPVDFAMQLEF